MEKIWDLDTVVGKFDRKKAKEIKEIKREMNLSFEEGCHLIVTLLKTASGEKVTEIHSNDGAKYFLGWRSENGR